MPRACIALRLRARLCRFATATTEGVVNGAAGVEERKVRRLTAGGKEIRPLGPPSKSAPALNALARGSRHASRWAPTDRYSACADVRRGTNTLQRTALCWNSGTKAKGGDR